MKRLGCYKRVTSGLRFKYVGVKACVTSVEMLAAKGR